MFGRFAKENADRLRRLGIAAQDMRRAVRTLFQKQMQLQQLSFSTNMGFLANTSRAVQQRTPHEVLVGTMTHSEKFGYRTQVSTQIPAEAIANIRADKAAVLSRTGCMTMEGLLRPFSTELTRIEGMPHFETGSLVSSENPGRTTLDPFGDESDIDILLTGSTFKGMHTKKKKYVPDTDPPVEDTSYPDTSNIRALGLRGPLVLVGWGFEYTGKPVPNDDSDYDPETGLEAVKVDDWGVGFLEDHRLHPERWKSGPVGLFWDNWRKIWTIPTFLFGTLDGDLDSGGNVKMTIDGTGGDKVRVYEYFGLTVSIPASSNVCAAYDQLANKWKVIAASCPG